MKYNKNAQNYSEYIEAIKKESLIQSRFYKQIGMTRNKIKKAEREIFECSSKMTANRLIKLMDFLNNNINMFASELEHSKDRQKYFIQKICDHDFGLVTSEYIDEESNKCYQCGICLECDAEINDVEGPIFNHSIILNKVCNSLTFENYKKKLDEFKKLSEYYNSGYDYIIGENIVKTIMDEGKELKKK